MEVQESSDFERLSCVARMPAVDRWIHHYHQSIDTGWCFGVLTHFMMYYGVNLWYGAGLNYMVRQCCRHEGRGHTAFLIADTILEKRDVSAIFPSQVPQLP